MRYFLSILIVITSLFANEDIKLLELAYKHGLKPVPRDFASLMQMLHLDPKDITQAKIKLGKKLFFDKNLSLAKDISCASCHSFKKGGADALHSARGHKNQQNPFHLNTPTVFNTVFSKRFFWDGHSTTLQDQAKGPLQAPFEMSISPQLAVKRVSQNEHYKKMFYEAFGDRSIHFENIVDAIASYEKTLVTRGRYDDFLLGYVDALSKKEKEGFRLFITKGCVGCHNGVGLGGGESLQKFPLVYHPIWSTQSNATIEQLKQKYFQALDLIKQSNIETTTAQWKQLQLSLTDTDLQRLKNGFFDQLKAEKFLQVFTSLACLECHESTSYSLQKEKSKIFAFPFENKGGFLGAQDTQYFRVPLLRNVVQTKPYFHNGSIEKLQTAIKLMGIHQSRVSLSEKEIEKIISFFDALNGELVEFTY